MATTGWTEFVTALPLNHEYLLCHEQFGLGTAELAEIARAGPGRPSAASRPVPRCWLRSIC
jgi:hypothetical protein